MVKQISLFYLLSFATLYYGRRVIIFKQIQMIVSRAPKKKGGSAHEKSIYYNNYNQFNPDAISSFCTIGPEFI
jgi:hypothetical protein